MARGSEPPGAHARLIAVGLGVALLMPPVAGAARAESTSAPPSEPTFEDEALDATHKATAQELFDEGRRLMAEGRIEEACRDFAESQRLDPALGTRFNLAECYEKLGKLASAWVHYVGVADGADRRGQMDRAAFARARAEALEPGLARMSIEVPQPVEGMVVSRNGVRIGSAQWDKPIPVDRGEYAIEATAPGYEPWRESVSVPEDGITVTVSVPVLVREDVVATVEPPPGIDPAPPAPTPDTGPGPRRLNGLHIAGIAVGGLGVVGLGVGSGFGVLAIQRKDEADLRCPQPMGCFEDGAQSLDDARRAGTISTVTLVAGGVLLATGIVLLATAPLRSRRRADRVARRPRARSWIRIGL